MEAYELGKTNEGQRRLEFTWDEVSLQDFQEAVAREFPDTDPSKLLVYSDLHNRHVVVSEAK